MIVGMNFMYQRDLNSEQRVTVMPIIIVAAWQILQIAIQKVMTFSPVEEFWFDESSQMPRSAGDSSEFTKSRLNMCAWRKSLSPLFAKSPLVNTNLGRKSLHHKM